MHRRVKRYSKTRNCITSYYVHSMEWTEHTEFTHGQKKCRRNERNLQISTPYMWKVSYFLKQQAVYVTSTTMPVTLNSWGTQRKLSRSGFQLLITFQFTSNIVCKAGSKYHKSEVALGKLINCHWKILLAWPVWPSGWSSSHMDYQFKKVPYCVNFLLKTLNTPCINRTVMFQLGRGFKRSYLHH